MSVQLVRRLFTVDEYDQMAQAGILTADDHVELLDGEIVQMTPIGSRHADCVNRLTQLFVERLARRAVVSVQNPIRLDDRSEPQPDLALLSQRPGYADAHPGPGDVLLLVEVADTSVDTDREVKIPLYARARIPEIWLLDLAGHGLEIYRQPASQGYQDFQRLEREHWLAPIAFPDLQVAVGDLLGAI